MTADPVIEAVTRALASLPQGAAVVVAFSGGLDSTVLLHACVASRRAGASDRRIIACHVDHGLQPAAGAFAAHCEREAAGLGVRFDLRRAVGRPERGESIEAWARAQRYRALADCATAADAQAIVTAHHADDQAETVLIGLARGGGLHALAGVRAEGELQGLALLRPLLALPRSELRSYCGRHSLPVVDDPMNSDPTYLRSALRAKVMPALAQIAPAFVASAARSAGLIADAARLLDELAQADLAPAVDGRAALQLGALVPLSRARQANALRHWLAGQGAPMPSQARLSALLEQSFGSHSAHALWRHAGWCVVRYRDRLQALAPGACLRPERGGPAVWRGCWRGESEIEVPDWGLVLRVNRGGARGLAFELDRPLLESGPIVLRAAAAGMRIRPGPQARSRTVRKRWQELGVPPWLRGWLPELSVGEKVLGVVGLGVCDGALGVPGAGEPMRVSIGLGTPDDPRSGWVLPYN